MIKKVCCLIKDVFRRNRFVENYKCSSVLRGKINIQLLASGAFFLLTVANIFSKSYTMLILTASGFVVNLVFAIIAEKLKKDRLCSVSSVLTCSVLFGYFVICGGNDGFACLWVVLLPLLSMAAMDFVIGLCASAFFQVFLIVVFWTPIRELLLYQYNEQFCLRFPLFFLISFILGLSQTISLRRSEYNECKQLLELEKMTEKAQILARTDPLTKLANRRFAYEEFELKYVSDGIPHCIVMGDIDCFKRINDTYGHEFGDEVLVIFAKIITEFLPQEYLKSRWGGEEFLFAANLPIAEVYAKIEDLRKTIADHEFICNGESMHITITFGIAEYQNKDGLSKAISKADFRLYNGKRTHKNCTVIDD